MSKHNVDSLKALFIQASEIAKQVPESMQEAAFHRALDLLAGTETAATDKNRGAVNSKPNHKSPTIKTGKSGEIDLLVLIDSTQYPEIKSFSKVLDKALSVLKIALIDHEVDGLSPAQISQILTSKFRLSTTREAVNVALSRAAELVNRVPVGKGFIYKIMGPGEDYLETLISNPQSKPKTNIRRKTKSKESTPKARSSPNGDAKVSENSKKDVADKKTKGARSTNKSSVSPKDAIIALISSGFFSTPKTLPQIQSYLKSKRGHQLTLEQLGVCLLRLVREEKLDRDENAEGKYEYKAI